MVRPIHWYDVVVMSFSSSNNPLGGFIFSFKTVHDILADGDHPRFYTHSSCR